MTYDCYERHEPHIHSQRSPAASIVKPYVTEAGHTVTTHGRTNFLRRPNQSHSTPVVYVKLGV